MRSVTIVFVELVLLSMVYAMTESPVTSAGATNTTSATVQPAPSNVTANATTSETAKADNSSTNATESPKAEGVNNATTNYTEVQPAVTPSNVWVPVPEVTCGLSSVRCTINSDCCSNMCEKLHSGADYRCLRSWVDKPCKHDYNCEGKLQCSPQRKTCCVDTFQSCVIASQCCNTEHRCLAIPGFVYKKCVYSDATRTAWGLVTLPSMLAITKLMVHL